MSTNVGSQPLVAEPSHRSIADSAGEPNSAVSKQEMAAPPPRSFSARTFLVAALFLVGIAIVGFYFGNKTLTMERHHPVLEVTPESLDFGRVDSTTDFPWKLRVTNVSSRTVEVDDIRASCGCTHVKPSRFTMEPGTTREVELHMNLVLTKDLGAKGQESAIEVKVVPIISGATLQQPNWILKGKIVTPCLLQTNTIVFAGRDALTEGKPGTSKQVLATLAYDDLKVTPHATHSGDLVEVAHIANKQITISVRPDANRPQGWFSSAVDLEITGKKNKTRGVLKLNIQGEVLAPFNYSPKALEFGVIPVGSRVQLELSISTHNGKLLDASPVDGQVETTIDKTNAEHARLIVRCKAKEVGRQKSALYLIFQTDDGAVSTAEVPVWYTGQAVKAGEPTVAKEM